MPKNHTKSNKLVSVLKELGLSEKEAGVYHAALALGTTTALTLSRATGIKRPTVYLAIESLKQKGLMSVLEKGFKKEYVAENPEKLAWIIDARRGMLDKYLADFASLYNAAGEKNIIQSFEGLDAMKAALEEGLASVRTEDDYFVISDTEQWLNLDREYFLHFAERRAKRKLNLKLLLLPSGETLRYKPFEHAFGSKVKIFPDSVSFSSNVSILPDRIVVSHMEPPYATLIVKNPALVKMWREVFLLLWNFLPS